MFRYFFILTLFVFPLFTYAQNKHVSLGSANYGICLGNSANYNGIRFNLLDKNVNNVNGLNVTAVLSRVKNLNGINIGAIALWDTSATCNGINVGGAVSATKKSNGINIGGIGALAYEQNGIAAGFFVTGAIDKFNGIGFAFLATEGDTLNGLFFGGGWVAAVPQSVRDIDKCKLINGVALSVLSVDAEKMNGIAISALFNEIDTLHGMTISFANKSEQLHGFEFGLINYAGNNRKPFRYTPFFNFNLRKKKKTTDNAVAVKPKAIGS
jgi:hypothetical protein